MIGFRVERSAEVWEMRDTYLSLEGMGNVNRQVTGYGNWDPVRWHVPDLG